MANLNDLLSPATSVYHAAGAAVAAPLATVWAGGLTGIAYGLQSGQAEATLLGAGLWVASALWSRFTLASLRGADVQQGAAGHYGDDPLAAVKAALHGDSQLRQYRSMNLQNEWFRSLMGCAMPSCELA